MVSIPICAYRPHYRVIVSYSGMYTPDYPPHHAELSHPGVKAEAGFCSAQDYAARSARDFSTWVVHNHEGERGGELARSGDARVRGRISARITGRGGRSPAVTIAQKGIASGTGHGRALGVLFG